MGTRILIQLAEPEAKKGELPGDVKQLLDGAGATEIRASHRELPGLYTASVPADAKVNALLEELKRLPAVRHAEKDQLRTTL